MRTHEGVTIAIPVLDEEAHIGACLDAVASQTYPEVVEVLVVDGGSSDRTRELAAAYPGVRVLDNPDRIQASGLNVALREAKGQVFVRIDARAVVANDYVEQCVAALRRTGAGMVGGGMTPVARGGWVARGIAAAMSSPFGAGPARFHRGGAAGWVDTVYLGAYRTEVARQVGGYARMAVNEDAEFAVRMGDHGGVWYDPAMRSVYVPRDDLVGLARQFARYGRFRAATVRIHPRSLASRQLLAPLLVLGLLSPWRRRIGVAYAGALAVAAARHAPEDPPAAAGMMSAIPVMHLAWGLGFLSGMVSPPRS